MGDDQWKLAACVTKAKPIRAVYPGDGDSMENINVETLKRMETLAQETLKLFPEQRTVFFRELIQKGILTTDEAKCIEEYVCLYRLMTDHRYYKAVQSAVCEMLLTTFKQEEFI